MPDFRIRIYYMFFEVNTSRNNIVDTQQVLTVILCHDGTQRTKLYNALYNIEKTSYIVIYDHLRIL